MACNRLFGDPTRDASPAPKVVSPFLLEQCDVAIFDPEAWKLFYDYSTLVQLEAEGAKGLDPTWAGELLFELNRFANIYDEENRERGNPRPRFFRRFTSITTRRKRMSFSAIGHAHIDTAWLWPLAEPERKCERTFSTAPRYMDEYPEYRFACSQAYQYEMIKKRNPDLYARIKHKAKTGQWIPVGGTWIEPDCNIPSGESLCRQFLYGQRFFEKEFGDRCNEFWNPDVFGYNGQLPQIMRLAGIKRFLTQKLSWNRFNTPARSHLHLGGDRRQRGLRAFSAGRHLQCQRLRRSSCGTTSRNYKDHDRSRHSLMLFGFGDGGGGPTKQMIENLLRAKDLQGLPRTQNAHASDEFFDLLEKDLPEATRPTVIGELYFEYHRGTYTTQAANKRDNRKSEFLLHEVEFLSAIASKNADRHSRGATHPRFSYPTNELDRLWKILLLNQFHDILPGSSITLVYEDSKEQYADIRKSGDKLRTDAMQALLGKEMPRTCNAPEHHRL